MTARAHAFVTLARVAGPPDVIEARTVRPRATNPRSTAGPEFEGAADRGGRQFLVRSLREMR